VRELVAQDLREPEMLLAPVRRLAPGECDLRGDPATLPLDRHTQGCLLGTLGGVEVGGDDCLGGFGAALELFEGTDQVDAGVVVEAAVEGSESAHDVGHRGGDALEIV
jgi:hypothetical protein